ncbi:general transcriptional corepressor CYC8 [Nematocida sp. LUAm3]|nr:general transcriptional corepressor CYC8 [Nematocida sp. LUAm3]KAI5174877.1 general transcriptional corepressor CYC8 [Nematocida sp. LUAm2]KAI5177525.1 general transcriptional corepressor CYC8 [Nematocida sp. LUAm1]
MNTDTKINLLQDSWKNLPGIERVPSLPAKMHIDIYTKLLLENEASWISIANLFKECHMEKNICYAYERALSNNPMSHEALSAIGPIYRKQKNYVRALDVFLRLYKLSNGEDVSCAANIGFCYLMLDNFTESLIWFKATARHASHIKEEKGFLWYGIGVFYERMNNLQTAEEAYASAIKMDLPFNYTMETYFRLGVTYKKRGATQTAMDCFDYLIHNLSQQSVSPSKEDVMVQIAHIHEMQGRTQEAVEVLKEICRLDTRNESAAMLLSWVYYKEGEWEASGEILKIYLHHAGNKATAFTWYMIGRCEQKAENYTEAYKCYHMALMKDPMNHFYWNSIGTLYFGLLQYEDAMQAFKKAIEISSTFIEASYNLGVLYEQFESAISSAQEVYEEILSIFPGDRLTHDRLEEIEAKKEEKSQVSQGTEENPDSQEEYSPPDLFLRDIMPNPTKTPYFLPHALLGHKPTTFIFYNKKPSDE